MSDRGEGSGFRGVYVWVLSGLFPPSGGAWTVSGLSRSVNRHGSLHVERPRVTDLLRSYTPCPRPDRLRPRSLVPERSLRKCRPQDLPRCTVPRTQIRGRGTFRRGWVGFSSPDLGRGPVGSVVGRSSVGDGSPGPGRFEVSTDGSKGDGLRRPRSKKVSINRWSGYGVGRNPILPM